MNNTRKQTIKRKLEKTGWLMKESYAKKEIESQLRGFQDAVIKQVFQKEHSKNFRMEKVLNHIEGLAKKYDLDETTEVKQLIEDIKKFEAEIAIVISGNVGEQIVKRQLKLLRTKNSCLANVILLNEDFETEIDQIVITEKGIFLIEVKNSCSNMIITEQGYYKRNDEETDFRINLLEKIRIKEYLLNHFLENAEMDLPIKIKSLVVFAKDKYDLENHCKLIESMKYNELLNYIEESTEEDIYSEKDIRQIEEVILKAGVKREYTLGFDANEFREHFSEVMAMLEEKVEQEREAFEQQKNYEAFEQQTEEKEINGKGWKKAIIVGTSVVMASAVGFFKIIKSD